MLISFAQNKAPRCAKGYPCGRSCVAKKKRCRNPLTGQEKTFGVWLNSQIVAGKTLSLLHNRDARDIGAIQTPYGLLKVNELGYRDNDVDRWQEWSEEISVKDQRMRINAELETHGGAASRNAFYGELAANATATRWIDDRADDPSALRSTQIKIMDERGNAQLLMSHQTDADSLYIEAMSTAPWNAGRRFDLLDDRQVGISATAGLLYAVQQSRTVGKGGVVTTVASDRTLPFFEAAGFVKEGRNDSQSWNMRLSADKAVELEEVVVG